MFKFQKRQQKISNNNHALVIGGGIAGLLAARVLLNYFKQVTVVERDSLPEQPQSRSGVPQAVQSHAILVRGQRILEQLFPGLNAQLIAAGAISVDWSADVLYFNSKGIAPRVSSELISPMCSRNLLEWAIRRYLSKFDRLQFLEATQVKKLLADESQSRVIGVQLHDQQNSQLGELIADLIVDASGRNSSLPKWLGELGYPAPAEMVLDAHFGYTTRWYKRPEFFQADWKSIAVLPKPPLIHRCGVLYQVEGDHWGLSLYGFARDYPPTDEAGFLEFARTLVSPILYETVKEAVPLSPVYSYRHTENRRRYYEQLSQFPEGVVAIGDAVFAFNPYYGQGITAAALSALVLDRCLHQRWQQPQNNPMSFSQYFQKQLACSLKSSWLYAIRGDRVWLTSKDSRPSRSPNLMRLLLQQYLKQVMLLSTYCPNIHRTIIEIHHMVKSPLVLFQPNIAISVIRQMWQSRRSSETEELTH